MVSLIELATRTRQGLLLGVGFIILIVLAAMTTWLVDQASSDAQLVIHTRQVQDTLSDILLNVRRAESGQRGYLFTNQARYLDDFNEARPEVDKSMQDLRALVQDNPARIDQAARMRELIDAKFAEMNGTIELNRTGQRDEARQLVLGGTGRDLAVDLRKLVDAANADEGRLLAARSAKSLSNNNRLMFASLAGTALIMLIGGLSVYLVQRNSQQREIAQRELASNNANLERIVAFRTADLQEANDEIQRFAYIVSHDLRSPLVNIMGFTSELEALRKDIFERVAQLQQDIAKLEPAADAAEGDPVEDLGKDFDEALGFIKTSIARMDRLINAVLKLSREGRRQFNPERLDMKEMMGSVVQSVAHRATEAGTKIAFDELPGVESDRLAIEQIFSNLVDNALKYRRDDVPGHIEIVGHESPIHAVYEVRDNGRGIAPQDHQRVFELFRRAGTQDQAGEGIGLAHVRALVRRIGGNIALSSELGRGSTFTVTLPRQWTLDNRSAA